MNFLKQDNVQLAALIITLCYHIALQAQVVVTPGNVIVQPPNNQILLGPVTGGVVMPDPTGPQISRDPLEIKKFQDQSFDMYSIPQMPERVDFDRDIVRWGDRVYYWNPDDRAQNHYIYADITLLVDRNANTPGVLRDITEKQIFENATDYVTGYISPLGVVGSVLQGSGKGVYPVPLDNSATHTISLTTHRRVDRQGNFEGFYGGSKIEFLDRMMLLIETGTAKKVRPELQNAIFDLSAQRTIGLRADQVYRPIAPR
jgi:hypothetical protein